MTKAALALTLALSQRGELFGHVSKVWIAANHEPARLRQSQHVTATRMMNTLSC